MKKLLLYCTLLLTGILWAQSPDALKKSFDELSQLSSPANVNQQIGITDVDISYYRPNANGRKIWGDLVPYDKVWRAGANFATTITFTTDIRINNEKLKAGKYALFVLPTRENWTFIFNSRSFQFGTFFYQGKTDVLRILVKPRKTKSTVESLKYSFDNIVFNKGNLTMAWGEREGTMNITTNIDDIVERVNARANNAKNNKNSQAYVDVAAWAIDHNMMIDKVEDWLGSSREIEESFGNNFLEARLAAHYKKYDEAISLATKVAQKFPSFKSVTDSFISIWEKEK